MPGHLFNKFFADSNSWTLDAAACVVYPITETQLPKLAAITDFIRRR